MKNVSLHIAYLLLTCGKVNVNGLGSFFTKYERASFDLVSGNFFPGHFKVLFTEKKTLHDSKLEESLSRKLHITREEALNLILCFTKRVVSTIKKANYCRVEGLGYLMRNSSGEISLIDTFWKLNNHPTSTALHIS